MSDTPLADLVIRVEQVDENGVFSGNRQENTFLQIKFGSSNDATNLLGEPFFDPFRDQRRYLGVPQRPAWGKYLWDGLQGALARSEVDWQEQVNYMRGFGQLLWSMLPSRFHEFYWDT